MVLVPVLLVALLIGTLGSRGPRTNADRVNAIASEFKCPTCRSESVETSNAQTSRIIRADIARRVEAGQIRRRDPCLSHQPLRRGATCSRPQADRREQRRVDPAGVVLVAAIAGLAVAFRRWRATPSRAGADRRRSSARRRGADGRADASDQWRLTLASTSTSSLASRRSARSCSSRSTTSSASTTRATSTSTTTTRSRTTTRGVP